MKKDGAIRILYLMAAILILLSSHFVSASFVVNFGPRRMGSNEYRHGKYLVPLETEDDEVFQANRNNGEESEISSLPVQLLDWNASGSIGSLLLQMQRKEEEMRKLNKTLLDKGQAVDLSRSNSTSSLSSKGSPSTSNTKPSRKRKKGRDELGPMHPSKIKELDESISIRIKSSPGNNVELVDLPELYSAMQEPLGEFTETMRQLNLSATPTSSVSQDLPQLSRADHYEERIGRDMRQLAVSIASCIDDTEDFKLYSQQIQGGLMPLIECIKGGCNSIRDRKQPWKPISIPSSAKIKSSYSNSDRLISSDSEEQFFSASSACRALRDLCGLSSDLASVLTDTLLQANSKDSDSPTLMEDLATLLHYAHDADIDLSPSARKNSFFLRRRKQPTKWKLNFGQSRREARLQCKLYILQLFLSMVNSSDSAVDAMRSSDGVLEAVLRCSSYARVERTRRWLRYPAEMAKSLWRKSKRGKGNVTTTRRRRPFIEAASVKNDLNGKVQGTANQVLAAMGYNQWVPKIPGQKGLRILCLDGGGSRGMTSVIAVNEMVKALGGVEVADCFDMVVGTSTGAIIAFLVGLKRETSEKAIDRYDVLIPNIFTKSALSTPLLLFTTATYDESPFMNVLSEILEDETMLDSRADPAVPYVSAVTSKMSSTPTHVALFRNYNYNRGELPDPFVIDPEEARENLGLSLEYDAKWVNSDQYPGGKESKGVPWQRDINASRHPGSFRVLQRYALRASTAAPTVFKPVLMGGEMYCDGGIVASNPTAIAIHEARTLFPDVDIEMVVSVGTGGFLEQKSAPRIGWDGIIGQIVDSACDGEQIHHILDDILGNENKQVKRSSSVSNTRYVRFNPILGYPDEFPIDITDPKKLEQIKMIARNYMKDPVQQEKLKDLADLLQGRKRIRRWFGR